MRLTALSLVAMLWPAAAFADGAPTINPGLFETFSNTPPPSVFGPYDPYCVEWIPRAQAEEDPTDTSPPALDEVTITLQATVEDPEPAGHTTQEPPLGVSHWVRVLESNPPPGP